MSDLPRNIRLDLRTVAAMVHLYCEREHASVRGAICERCAGLLQYAEARLRVCPFGEDKTTCRDCPIHCYRPVEREDMRIVMREAGPRMLWRHPWLAIRHLWIERKGPPPWPPRKKARPAGER
jgi:hypothetical protein